MNQDIHPEVDKDLIERELTTERFVKKTNNGDNLIYIVTAENAPNTMIEIGRLREITFRDAGGGTGKALDIDEFDTGENAFSQLIVWNPRDRAIVGGYRFIHGKEMRKDGNGLPVSPVGEIFHFSERFVSDYLPVTIELGRSWVQPEYQPTNNFRKGIYALDNLWDGLGGLITTIPDTAYFFGKITMYTTFNTDARDFILGFLSMYFPDKEKLVTPHVALAVHPQLTLEELKAHFSGDNYDQDFKTLVKLVRKYGEQVPPLVNAYMNLTGTMKTFGTSVNPFFGGVEETGILICIADIYPEKTERHLVT